MILNQCSKHFNLEDKPVIDLLLPISSSKIRRENENIIIHLALSDQNLQITLRIT